VVDIVQLVPGLEGGRDTHGEPEVRCRRNKLLEAPTCYPWVIGWLPEAGKNSDDVDTEAVVSGCLKMEGPDGFSNGEHVPARERVCCLDGPSRPTVSKRLEGCVTRDPIVGND